MCSSTSCCVRLLGGYKNPFHHKTCVRAKSLTLVIVSAKRVQIAHSNGAKGQTNGIRSILLYDRPHGTRTTLYANLAHMLKVQRNNYKSIFQLCNS